MTEIYAIVRRQGATATRMELKRAGCPGYTVFPVLGRGRQRGLRTAGQTGGVGFLPRMLFYLVVEDERAMETIEAIIRANQTGEFGDGRMFISQIERAGRISDQANTTEKVLT